MYRSRHPKLFFVSSSSTTSTLSTTTLCYSTSTTFTTTACSGKKKRAIYTAPVEETLDLEDYIKPQPIVSERYLLVISCATVKQHIDLYVGMMTIWTMMQRLLMRSL